MKLIVELDLSNEPFNNIENVRFALDEAANLLDKRRNHYPCDDGSVPRLGIHSVTYLRYNKEYPIVGTV